MLNRKCIPFIILTGQILLTIAAVTLLNPECNKKIQIILAGLFFYTAGLITVKLTNGEKINTEKSFFNVFRLQRHDFQNRLQIIYSMIQLKNTEIL